MQCKHIHFVCEMCKASRLRFCALLVAYGRGRQFKIMNLLYFMRKWRIRHSDCVLIMSEHQTAVEQNDKPCHRLTMIMSNDDANQQHNEAFTINSHKEFNNKDGFMLLLTIFVMLSNIGTAIALSSYARTHTHTHAHSLLVKTRQTNLFICLFCEQFPTANVNSAHFQVKLMCFLTFRDLLLWLCSNIGVFLFGTVVCHKPFNDTVYA